MKTSLKYIPALLLLISIVYPAAAAEHYVSPTGSASWDKSVDIGSPCTLDTANAHVQAGDTVFLRTGFYDQYISPRNSGISEHARIIYRAYNNEKVSITGTDYAILIDGGSYITVSGISARNCRQFLIINGGHHNDIGHCSFDRNRDKSTWMGSWVHDSSTCNRIHHCTFSRFGWIQDGDDKGAVLDIGYDTSSTDATDRNVIEYNVFFHGGHHILHICGRNNVVRGNYFHNEEWMTCCRTGGNGNRNVMTIGPMAGQNLFEDNRIAFAGLPPDDNGANGLVLRSPDNIVRHNMCYGNGAAGIAFASMAVSNPTGNRVYANTIYHNGYNGEIDRFWTGGISFGNWGNGPMPGNIIINNILHGNFEAKSITGYGDAGEQIIRNNWMDEGDPGFLFETLPADPDDPTLPDFRLKPDSPCIDKAVPLTTVTSASGKGITLSVEDAAFFFDGWGIPGEQGDLIQLEGSTESARITEISYDTGNITMDRELTWTQGQGFGLIYAGSAPDLGGLEYADEPASDGK